jgi:hypothetical protein
MIESKEFMSTFKPAVGALQRALSVDLTQLNNVCFTRPNVRDAAVMLCPDSASRTASCLNSNVYRARIASVIFIPLLIVSYGIGLAGARSCSPAIGQ